MKTHLYSALATLFCATLCFSGLKAQSLEAVNPPTIVYGTVEDNLITISFDVKNISDTDLSVGVERIENSVIEGTINYFCWALCYSPAVDLAPTPLPIGAGESVDNFYADYKPEGIAGSSFIDYCFFDFNNPEDRTCVTIEYRISESSSISENEAVVVGSPQPNPAIDYTIIPFDLRESNDNAHLTLYNILGSEIKSVPVTGTSGNIDLNVSDLQSGVYIYSFFNANRLLSSSRLVIR